MKLFEHVIEDLVSRDGCPDICEATRRGIRLGMLMESVLTDGFAPFDPPKRNTSPNAPNEVPLTGWETATERN